MWSTGYNDLFSYPASALTPARMFESGLWMVTLQRLKAVGLNIESLVAVSGGVVLGPLMLVAIWKLRRLKLIRFMLVMMSIILLTMSIVFPFAGVRGGYFHSNAAFQIILWALVPAGLEIIIELGIRYRRWRPARAWKMFGAALIVTMCFISLFSLLDKVTHGIGDGVPWNLTLSRQEEINKLIIERINL